jgi:hypothetical protein
MVRSVVCAETVSLTKHVSTATKISENARMVFSNVPFEGTIMGMTGKVYKRRGRSGGRRENG